MDISARTNMTDTSDAISNLETALVNFKFAHKVLVKDQEINFKISYGLQKVKCNIRIIDENDTTSLCYTSKTDHEVIFNRGLQEISNALSKDIENDWYELGYCNPSYWDIFYDATFAILFSSRPLQRVEALIAVITLMAIVSAVTYICYIKLVPIGVSKTSITIIAAIIFSAACGFILMRRLENTYLDERVCTVAIISCIFIPVLWGILIVIALILPESYFLSDDDPISISQEDENI